MLGRQVGVQQFLPAFLLQPPEACSQFRDQVCIEHRLNGFLPVSAQGRQPKPQRRQHAGQRVEQYRIHAQFFGDRAGVLTACAAERAQGEVRRIFPSLYRNLFNRCGHLVDGDPQEALGGLLGGHPRATFGQHLPGKPVKAGPGRFQVQLLPAVGPEDSGKHAGLYPAQHKVGIRYGQRAAVSIAGRPRTGACGLGPGKEPSGMKAQDRSASRRYGMNLEHRRTQPGAGDLVVGYVLIAACIQRDIGGRPAHVKANEFLEPRLFGGARGAYHAGRRTGKDGVLAPESARFDQPSVALHERQVPRRQLPVFQPGAQPLDIAAQHRRQVRVHESGIAAADQLDQR